MTIESISDPREVFGCSKITKLYPKVFDFCESLKMREKKYLYFREFFLLLFYFVQREDAHR